MWLDNFALSMAQGPFLLFAFAIGLIVSIDVFGLEFTRNYEPETFDGKPLLRTGRMKIMARWHATFHAGSFCLYMFAIYVGQSLAFLPIELFNFPPGVGLGLLTLINFVVVSFVWWTYRSKIREDHSTKSDDAKEIERRDMRFMVDGARLLALRLKLGDKASGIAVAGSVAVDMLAISALLKSFLLPNAGVAPTAHMTGFLPADIFIFAAVVFVVVYVVVVAAQSMRIAIQNSRLSNFISISFRLLEPFAVFLVMAGALRSIKHIGITTYALNMNGFGMLFDAAFATVVVLSLVVGSGIKWRDLKSTYCKPNFDATKAKEAVGDLSINDVFDDVKGLKVAALAALLMLIAVLAAMWISYSTSPGRDTHNHLIEATAYIAELIVAGTVVFLYFPLRFLDKYETKLNDNIVETAAVTPHEFWTTILGALIGLLALNVFNTAVFGFSFEVEAIIMWSFYILFSWLLFDLRRWRFFEGDGRSLGAGRANDSVYAELISAVGIASAVVALIAHRIVAQLVS